MSNKQIGLAGGVPDDKKLVARLKEAREYMGISQEKVATYLGVPRSAVSEIESGKRSVSALELQRLAKLYQKSIGWFTDDVIEGAPPEIEYLARTAAELSQNDRGELQKFAEFLKAKSEAKNDAGS